MSTRLRPGLRSRSRAFCKEPEPELNLKFRSWSYAATWEVALALFVGTNGLDKFTESKTFPKTIFFIAQLKARLLRAIFIKRFTLSLDPILIVLLKLTLLRQKKGGPGPPEIKVGGLGPCGPPRSATYDARDVWLWHNFAERSQEFETEKRTIQVDYWIAATEHRLRFVHPANLVWEPIT